MVGKSKTIQPNNRVSNTHKLGGGKGEPTVHNYVRFHNGGSHAITVTHLDCVNILTKFVTKCTFSMDGYRMTSGGTVRRSDGLSANVKGDIKF